MSSTKGIKHRKFSGPYVTVGKERLHGLTDRQIAEFCRAVDAARRKRRDEQAHKR